MTLSPDGIYYLRDAAGLPVPAPYQRRWLLPRLLGPYPRRWALLTLASLLATPVAAWAYYAPALAPSAALAAVALLCSLPGVWRCPARFPVLTDAPAFALALATAALARNGHVGASVALSLALGATRETGPVFAALWAWNPWPLVGLLGARWLRTAAPPDAPWLARPVASALALRAQIGLDASLYLVPWGATLAGLVAPTWQVVVTLAVAHAQLLAAQDTIRLTVWAAPPLVAAAVGVVPLRWVPLAVLWVLTRRDGRV